MNTKTLLSSALMAVTLAGAALAGDAPEPTNTPAAAPAAPHVLMIDGAGFTKGAVIEAGVDPGSVELHFRGAQKVVNAFPGGLDIVAKDGTMWHYRPQVYQMVGGKRHPVSVAYKVVRQDSATLVVKGIDASAPLIVTPVAEKNL